MKSKLELNQMKTELLLRAALLDDAVNTSERLGALLAEIIIDEDGDAWLALDEDLWPEDKEPQQATAVAGVLGIELEQELTSNTAPFPWPALGQETTSTAEYVSVLLDAYAGREIDFRRQ